MGGSSRPQPERAKPKGRKNSPSRSSWQHASCGDGRFYGGGDDGFWRLSFGEEDDVMKRRDRCILRSVLYESDDEVELPLSSCRSCRSSSTKVGERGESQKFSDMVSDERKMRKLHGDVEISLGNGAHKGEKGRQETKFKIPRQETVKERRSRKANGRVLKEKWSEFENELDAAKKSTKSVEKHSLKPEPVSRIQTKGEHSKLTTSHPRKHRHAASMNLRSSILGTIEEDCTFASLNLEEPDAPSKEEKRKLKEMDIKELMSKSENQRKSIHLSRELQSRTKQRSKIRVHSPRTPSKVEICKIKALEDMKAKMKMKKKIEERILEGRTQIESFAVVKSSLDPQKDFRDSMIEMIMEKGISQPEELEELLACYLTLNSDEYHDLIIKVFRQVWFGLNRAHFDPELQNEHCYE